MTPSIFLPSVSRHPQPTPTPTPPPADGRVVHVHDGDAVSWTGQTDYWNYVDQSVVNDMVDRGMMALTGATTVANAWRALLPAYRSGEIIAIKVNLNNATECNDADEQIDALMQPVNAVIRGLKTMGVAEGSICVYDASRSMPNRFVQACLYSGVVLRGAVCQDPVTWSSTDPHASITFTPPPGAPAMPATRIDDVLIDCSYLINMPILKPHRIAGVTLTFKNHFGDITSPWNLHPYIRLTDPAYRVDYNPLVDIYRNPHIGNKTVLIVGDGLLAAHDYASAPSMWQTFGGRPPCSLLFSRDPVAVDSVMCDLLEAELGLASGADDYLRLADQAELGIHERGDPWGAGYSEIDYIKLT